MGVANTIKESVINIFLVGATAFSAISVITIIGILRNTVDPSGWFPESKDLPGVLTAKIFDPNARKNTRYVYTGKASTPFAPITPQPDQSQLPTVVERVDREKLSPKKKWRFYYDKKIRKPSISNGNVIYTFKYGGENLAIAWSPDSKHVGYTLSNNIKKPYFDGRVYILDLETGKKTLISSGDYSQPIWFTEPEFNDLLKGNQANVR